jgi:hypothetical protein
MVLGQPVLLRSCRNVVGQCEPLLVARQLQRQMGLVQLHELLRAD